MANLKSSCLIGDFWLFSTTLGVWSLDVSFSVCSLFWSCLHRLHDLSYQRIFAGCFRSSDEIVSGFFFLSRNVAEKEISATMNSLWHHELMVAVTFQERIAKSHGSQCGFCTPGIVMSMYTLLRNKPKPKMEDIEDAFQGNTHTVQRCNLCCLPNICFSKYDGSATLFDIFH